MTITGRCRCGAIRWAAEGGPEHHSLCHCADCRRSSGAPMVGWVAFRTDRVTVAGQPVRHESSPGVVREFCGTCGTGLFYRNPEAMPGIVDVQSGTLDDPEASPPVAHIQTAERLGWMRTAHELPAFERFPE